MKCKSTFCLILFGLLAHMAWAQNITVSGTVTDETGEVLPGTNVIEAGTSNGVISDFDGNYQINAAADGSLIFSYVGYDSQTININNRTEINITLKSSSENLDEVVVIGYSSKREEDILSSVSTVKSEEILETGITNLSQTLQDRLPGVVTELSTGQPGSDNVDIIIRGASSFTGRNAPLVLVDGIEIASGLAQIDPGDIDQFTVLKDAVSTAIYGVRGANGVILITTKRGKAGPAKITVSAGIVAKTVADTQAQLSAYDVLNLGNEAVRNSGNYNDYYPQRYINNFRYSDRDQIRYPDVDWYDALIADVGWESNARINVTGGTERVKYFTSFSANKVGDVLQNADFDGYYDPKFTFDRYTFRTNLDFDVTSTTKLSLYVSGRSELTRRPVSVFGGDGTNDQIFEFIDRASPYYFPVYYPEEWVRANPDPRAPNDFGPRFISTLERDPWQRNPYTLLNYSGLFRDRRDVLDIQLIGAQNLDMITQGLRISGKYSLSSNFRTTRREDMIVDQWWFDAVTGEWSPQRTGQNYGTTATGFRSGGSENIHSSNRNLYYEVKMDYQRNFGKHGVTWTGVFNRTRRDFNVSQIPSSSEDWVSILNYSYDDRYSLQINKAYNGSEKFAEGKRFGFFPGVGVGWNVTNEPFMKDRLSWLNRFKVRYGVGEVGSDQDAPRFLYNGGYTAVGNSFASQRFGLNPLPHATRHGITQIPNPDATWEVSVKHNLGFDIGLFNNELTFQLDLFDERRSGIFLANPVPTYFNPHFGNPRWGGRVRFPQINLGATKKYGFELVGNYSHVTPGGFTYGVGGFATVIDSRVLEQADLGGTPEHRRREGKPLGPIFALNTNGFYNTFEEAVNGPEVQGGNAPGSLVFADFDGDGVIDRNLDSAIQRATNQPLLTYAFNGNMAYKNFDFSIRFLGKGGVSYHASRFYPNFRQYLFEAKPYHLDRWSPENTDARFPAYSNLEVQQTYNFRTDQNLQNSAYLKLQSITLGYNITSAYLERLLRIKAMRLNLSGQNLYTWSRLPGGGDPEGGNAVEGTGIYPLLRRYLFTLDLTF